MTNAYQKSETQGDLDHWNGRQEGVNGGWQHAMQTDDPGKSVQVKKLARTRKNPDGSQRNDQPLDPAKLKPICSLRRV